MVGNSSERQHPLPKVEVIKNVSIVEVAYSSIPQPSLYQLHDRLEWNRTRNSSPKKNFESTYRVDAGDGITDYAGVFSFSRTKDHPASKRIDLVDSFGNEVVGRGTAWLIDGVANFENMPFVAYTTTSLEHLRQGLGMRRLQLLNALCLDLWSQVLRSSDSIRPEARGVWEKLCQMGLAEVWRDDANGKSVYRFKNEQGLASSIPQHRF